MTASWFAGDRTAYAAVVSPGRRSTAVTVLIAVLVAQDRKGQDTRMERRLVDRAIAATRPSRHGADRSAVVDGT